MSARELFEKFDVNGSGSITCAEVQNVLRELGVAGDYAAMVRAVDVNNDGTIDWDEFQEMMKSSDGLGAVIKEKRASILNVRLGAANSQHTFSREETEAFTEVINARLARDGQLASVLPLGAGGADPPLFAACADGVLLCRLIGLVDGDAVDERCINFGVLGKAGDRKATFKVVENCNLAINGAVDIGCRITNIGARDITEHRPHLILGVLWQIIRLLLTAKISLKEHPEMARLLEGDETLTQLLALPPEKILVRWINYHLAAAGSDRRVSNLGKDLKDSVVYATLMAQLYGSEVGPVDVALPSLEARAEQVLANAVRVGVTPFIKARDVASGNAKLNLAFVAQLFNDRPGLDAVEEAVAKELADLDLDDAGDTREARTFKLWINSLEAWAGPNASDAVQVRDLFLECCNGVPILAAMDAIKQGVVPWKKVRLEPRNRHHLVENGNHVVAVGGRMDLVLVNIGGVDIADGNKKLILAVMWQLMRQQTIDMLSSLKGDGTAVAEPELIAWANAKVAASPRPGSKKPIKSLNDKYIAKATFLLELCDAVGGGVVNWELVAPGDGGDDRHSNAKYALSVARKLGARVFCTPEDIVEVKPKMMLLFIAAVWQAELSGATTGGGLAKAASPAKAAPAARAGQAPPPRRPAPAAPPVPARAPAPPPVPPRAPARRRPCPRARPRRRRSRARAPAPPPRAPARAAARARAGPAAAARARARAPPAPARARRRRAPPPSPARAPPARGTRTCGTTRPRARAAARRPSNAAPPPPAPAAPPAGDNTDADHVVQYKPAAPTPYNFKSKNGTGETTAVVDGGEVGEDEW
ncbi:vacuolar protein sorting-associated protein [Aureococcus anophagefferens]|uniref:Vacuolar protein sorting-associated protein n=1 Tax=Aureococcus anophagefferens TaxID=44056 RepID=A0ABR1G1R5_AURAN